jgi:hypothetical protein
VQALQQQASEAQQQALAIQGQMRDTQSRVDATHIQVQHSQHQARNARRLTQVFAVLTVLALLTAGMVASQAARQRQAASQAERQCRVARQALAKATAEAAGKFDLASNELNSEMIRQVLQKIGGAEQAENRLRSLDHLATCIPREEIPAVLKASSDLWDDQSRSHFQQCLLVRLGLVNPVSAMTCAGAITGKIVNDAGQVDSGLYFQLAVLENWLKTDWPGAFNWVCQLSDAEARQRALEKVIPWVQSRTDSDAKNQALEDCIGELAKTDVPGALALAEFLPEEARRNRVTASLWLKTNPFAVSEWINHLDLPLAIGRPRTAFWPWTTPLLNTNFDSPTNFPVETESSSNSTNNTNQIQPPE